MKESILFLKQFFRDQNVIGGIAPSSKYLAKEIASITKFGKSSGIRNVLEIGPGTGTITEEILKNLGKEDLLTIIEINPIFFNLLKAKKKTWEKRADCPKIKLLNIDFLLFQTEEKFDHIIAGVPFNNFPSQILKGFIKKIKSITGPEGLFAYFEYIAARSVKKIITPRVEKPLSHFIAQEIYPYLIKEKRVFKNLPPAKVNFIKFQNLQ